MKTLLQPYFESPITTVKKLDGYANANYKVETDSGNFIFKTYEHSAETLAMVKAQNEVLLFVQDLDLETPLPIPVKKDSYIGLENFGDHPSIYRKLSFLEGRFLGDVDHSKTLFKSLGVFLARLDKRLLSLRNDTISARQWEWDIQYLPLVKKMVPAIDDAHHRNIVNYFIGQFEQQVVPKQHELRKSIIHNDANEWNVLIKDGKVSGIIDFGDIAHSFLINELAVAITYACYDKEDPLSWAIPIIKGYHKTLPLEENELEVLYYLIAARLCISVCNSAQAKKDDPGNEYISVSEKPAWRMLHRWLRINPKKALLTFRKAAGFESKAPKSIDWHIERRKDYFGENLSISYQSPIFVQKAAFQYMYDGYGNTFLDAYNNIPHVGHCHPKVVEAGQRQMAQLNTNTRYLYDLLPAYAEKLLSYFPKSLNKIFLVNSGSAASDLAIRMAKAHTQWDGIMVTEHGYHGNTQTSIDVSDYKFSNPKGQGQKGHILKTPIPDTYWGKYKNEDAGSLYAKDAIALLQESEMAVAAFISEPIVGCGGQVPLAKGYLKELYPAIRANGGICISDEVQTGFGRLGDHFWGFEAQEVIPDMVILGKPIGNGHPMGAVVCTQEIADSFAKGVEFFSSFGGNPVSCAIGMAVLETIEEENLQSNAKNVGLCYTKLLGDLKQKYPCIGDVRGSGLFLGLEIISEKTLKQNHQIAQYIKNELRKRHILISTDGPFDSVLKTKPPLCFSSENAKEVVDTIDHILGKYYQ
ncbi:aminotransferase class III-fold pyridoxal phosphate-dependent enzyme [Sungkyunkwania multivorans]|uniref:Aminotransferase class III-fold pyridoxal phosphate-dependent enzyme n=1 Tax=Sungkyunkwania multivorans TaxID=1173618 RepID=A0ABW3D3T3_9FLAO